ncbi:MAG: ABC transporter ATP-binding protein [Lachnospiraceae bacterium]
MEETNQDIAIEVKNLCVGYKNIKAYSIKKSLLRLKKVHVEEFQAVKNVSFQVPKGEILGIIGKNGSGKSTMLKAIAGIFSPDSGTIDLKGHTVSLLSIGVGFQKEVTGRENILLSGMLLGFSEQEIRAKMDEIIEFAELGKFIDMPVKTYSSGMYSKLAFSITAILETEIMLIDEVLSVGDQHFKKKSYKKMKELISNRDRTVVIVSHNISTLSSLCDKVMWMHDGEIKKIGDTEEILEEYQEFMK